MSYDFSHTSIEFNAVHIWMDDVDGEQIERYFSEHLQVPNVSVNRRLDSGSDEENDVVTFYGRLGFQKLNDDLNQFIKLFCSNRQQLLINFEDDFFTEIMTPNELMVSHVIKLHSFSLGTMTRLTTFIDHYSTLDNRFNLTVNDNEYVIQVSQDDLLARFTHSRSEIDIHFRLIFTPVDKRSTVKYRYQRFKLVLSYSSIHNMILKYKDWHLCAYTSISHPPSIYLLKKDVSAPNVLKKTHEDDLKDKNDDIDFEKDYWIRRSEFPGLVKDVFGKCNVISLDLFKHEDLSEVAEHEKPKFPSPFCVINSMLKFKKFAVYFGGVSDIIKDPPQKICIEMNDESFNIIYALEALQSISFQFANDLLFENNKNVMDAKLKSKLKHMSRKVDAFEKSLFELFEVIASGSFVRVLPFLRRAFERHENGEQSDLFMGNITKVRRAILTPTRTILLPPLPVMGSRFLLNSNPDYVLRLLLRDDDLQYLTFSLQLQDERYKQLFFDECFKKPLRAGIKVGDRCYEVVGSSQSQLRDNGICLYAKDPEERTAASIRSSFGTITEKNVSKYVARVGLILSQSQCFIDASDAIIKYDEPDVKYPHAIHPKSKKEYEFSDGCGMISVSYAKKLTEKLKAMQFLPDDALMPSAFQIRLGGCKGMLAVNPDLYEYDIVIRDSMRKFDSNDKMLGVLKVSDARKVYLNKPFITVLDQLGVAANVFLQMQFDVLQDILKCFISEKNAANILKQYCVLHSHIDYKELIAAKVNILNEPFFRLSLDNVIHHATHELKVRGRIMIPLENGRTMFGVMDETFTLNYGEVFVQASDLEDKSKTEIWKGKVLVSKFPCMDPGDVRIFRAVDNKRLRHLRDCIVFPAVGDRPHPNEMAGSDLDGDEYAVIRYKPLLSIKMQPAFEYPDTKATVLDREITIDDILDFYAHYIEEYSVGVIAKAHLAWADYLSNGIFNKICKKLAWMYSLSLDFAKTGVNSKLEKSQRVQICPDFMEKFSQKPTYLSKRVLGSLFRQISVFQIVFNEQNPLNVEGVDTNLFEHPLSDVYREDAIRAYNDYKHLMFNIQKTYKIATEFEIISGAYNKVDKFMSGKEEVSDAQNMVNKILRNGVRRLRASFVENCDDENQRLAKASAYYKVTKEINSTSNIVFYGLPWLFSRSLATLAKINQASNIRFENEETRLQFLGSVFDQKLIEYNRIRQDDEPGDNTLESRVKLAEEIIISWLERQAHLRLTLYTSKVLAKKKIKDILSVETKEFESDRTKVPSVGNIIIKTLKRLLSEEFTADFASSCDTKQFKFTVGFSSLMALYRLYRTQNVDHIILPRRYIAPKSSLLSIKSFRLTFDLKSDLCIFVKSKESQFFKYLQKLSGISAIKGEWYQRGKSWYFEVIAIGTQTQLYALCFFLSKLIFAKGPNIPAMIEKAVSSDESILDEKCQ